MTRRLGRPRRTRPACAIAAAGDSVVPRARTCWAPCRSRRTAARTSPCRPARSCSSRPWTSDGLAVQSMRSATYLQPGETAGLPGLPRAASTARRCRRRRTRWRCGARRRALQPDVDGSNPFSYPRLVQPVLDQHCVDVPREERRQGRRDLAARPADPWTADVCYASYKQPGAEVRLLRLRRRPAAPRPASSAPGRRSSTSCCTRATTT